MVEAKAVPPVACVYHLTDVPVAAKLATVALAISQKVWLLAVGAGVAVIVTVICARLALSQLFAVWLA
ncbi:hypothetical protein D3C86_1102370 [compost metagenome]